MVDRREDDASGESLVWSMIATLVAGPAVWGAIGYGVDHLVGTSGRVFTALGVVVGFIGGVYIVYVRSGGDAGGGTPPSSRGDAR